MSIEKKKPHQHSKTTKKANVASSEASHVTSKGSDQHQASPEARR